MGDGNGLAEARRGAAAAWGRKRMVKMQSSVAERAVENS
jgi:hypothetical protein